MIDAAIVGLGRWGRSFVESIQGKTDRVRFVHAVDPAGESVREFAAKHQISLAPDYASVLRDPSVAAVVLATPHSAHAEQVIEAAAYGKHIFCEKPLALNKADALRTIEACHKAGVVLGVGHNRRLWSSMQALKSFVRSGELGEILHVEGNHSNENSSRFVGTWRDLPAESPGGGMTGAGLHVLDAFIDLVGPLKRAHGLLLQRKPPPAPIDTASVVMEFASGVSGLLGTVRASPYVWRVHVFGALASAEAISDTELVLRRSGSPPERMSFAPAESLVIELEMFADAVEGIAAFPISPAQIVETVAAFELVIKSLKTGGSVCVDS